MPSPCTERLDQYNYEVSPPPFQAMLPILFYSSITPWFPSDLSLKSKAFLSISDKHFHSHFHSLPPCVSSATQGIFPTLAKSSVSPSLTLAEARSHAINRTCHHINYSLLQVMVLMLHQW